MIRSTLILLAIIILVSVAIGASGDAGLATLIWLGYRVDTSATAAVIIIGIMAFCSVSFWNLALWLSRAPQRSAKKLSETRRRQGDQILTRGFLAVATGDGAEARRCAVKAVDSNDNIALVRILGALAAECAQDDVATKTAYLAMMSTPELKMAGLKGMTNLALKQGDKDEAYRLASEAYAQAKPAMWSFKTLFDARLAKGEWAQARELIETALSRKLISPVFCDRAKASLMAVLSAQLETANQPQMRDQALDLALRAAKLQPSFTPAAIIAARLLAKAGKLGRAEDILESAYTAYPHPAISLAYRDLVINETPVERARRLQSLIDRNPTHLESRQIDAERAIISADKAEIKRTLAALENDLSDDTLTRRLCGLMTRAHLALRDSDAARLWTSKAAKAKSEPDWSDINAEGSAFAYSAADWSQIVLNFAQNATLAHPRFDRGEPSLPEMPDIASHYVPSIPFVRGVAKKAAMPDIVIPEADQTKDAAKPIRARKALPKPIK